jgi:hypothetical protein
MSIFSNILDKLGLNKGKPAAAAAPTPATTTPKPTSYAPSQPPVGMGSQPAAAAPKPAAISLVDVGEKLDAMAAKLPKKPEWRVSIADLLFLLGLDNSLAARKELAKELGCPADLMGGDYSQMNIWLHKTVMNKIAENGGSVPKELL